MNVREMFDLTGKVALVTGGSRGLGLQMARGMGEAGASVAICARSADELAEAEKQLTAEGITVAAVRHDLSDLEGADALVDAVVERLGDVDILVNNAAIAISRASEEVSLEDWSQVVDINLSAVFVLSRTVARRCMIPRGGGKIISISSIGGLAGTAIDTPYLASYSATKGAIISLTKALATEWGRHNINVNALAPGNFPTAMTAATLPAAHGRRVLSKTPLGRVGGDDDIKGVAVFFASEASRHLTGQYVIVDGGALTTAYPAMASFED